MRSNLKCMLMLMFFLAGFGPSQAEEVAEHRLDELNTAIAFARMSPEEQSRFLMRWRNVRVNVAAAGPIEACDFRTLSAVVSDNSKVKVGAPYILVRENPSVIARAAHLFASPAEAVAQRRMFAFKLSDLDTQTWRELREELRARSEPLSFSIVVGAGATFVGTPIKWNIASADLMESLLRERSQIAFPRQPLASELLAAGFVDESINWSNAVIGHHGSPTNVVFAPQAQTETCGYVVREKDSSVLVDAYVAFSDVPATLSGLESIALVTAGGVSGRVLGTEYPSWPREDGESPVVKME